MRWRIVRCGWVNGAGTPKATRNLMRKKAVVSIDLAAMAGMLKFVPGPHLPRHDKMLLERTVATIFLNYLSQHDGSAVADVQSNSKDPPDVTFTYNGELRGMELCEILRARTCQPSAGFHRRKQGEFATPAHLTVLMSHPLFGRDQVVNSEIPVNQRLREFWSKSPARGCDWGGCFRTPELN